MTDGGGKFFCPRLVDYIAIVGAKINQNNNPSQGTSGATNRTVHVPELLRRYPPKDHKDFPLPPDLVFFCQPEGCVSVAAERGRQSLRETNTFVFTLTEKDSNRVRYGMVVNFFMPLESRSYNPAPTSTASSSKRSSERSTPAPQDDSASECQESSGLRSASAEQESSKHHRHHHSHHHKDRSEGDDDEIKGGGGHHKKRRNRNRRQTNSLTSLCLISHHPFFSTFRECLFILKRLIEICSDKHLTHQRKKSSENTSDVKNQSHHQTSSASSTGTQANTTKLSKK